MRARSAFFCVVVSVLTLPAQIGGGGTIQGVISILPALPFKSAHLRY